MKATDIQNEVERTGNPAEFGGVVNLDCGRNPRLFYLLPGTVDGARCKVDTGYLPARFCERDNVRACTATNVDGSTGWLCFDEFEQFGGADARIPGRLAEIPGLIEKAAEQSMHFVWFECHKGKVTVLTLTIQLSSFTIMRLTTIPSV